MDRSSRTLFVPGVISGLSYLSVAVIFWTNTIFTLDWKSKTAQVVGIGLPAILYLRGIKAAKSADLRIIVGFALVFALIGFVTLPFDSTDVFFYMAVGWHQTHFDANPYTSVLRDASNGEPDGMINTKWMATNRNQWLDLPLPYGFLFAIVTRIVAWIGGGNWWLTLALFNLLNLTVHGAIALLLWKAATLIPEADPKFILYLYAWNPAVLAQSLANVHNDILMAFFVMIAVLCVLRNNPVWSIPALVMAALIKYVAVVLLPFALLFTWRRQGWRAALKGALLSALIVALTSGPYVIGLRQFRYSTIVAQWTESSASLHAFAMTLLHAAGRFWQPLQVTPLVAAEALRALFWVTFATFGVSHFIRSYRAAPSATRTLHTWNALMFGVICLASSQFYSWYLGMFFPVAVLCAGTFSGQATILMTATHILAFTDLRRKGIGYFTICTLIPLVFIYLKRRSSLRGKWEESSRRDPLSGEAIEVGVEDRVRL